MRLHSFFPMITNCNSNIKQVGVLSQVRFKHKRAPTGSGGSLHNARSGKRESGKTHHGKFENEIENEESSSGMIWQQDESNKLLDDK